MTSREEEIRLHHEKWKKWKMQLRDQNIKKLQNYKAEDNTEYAAKIIKKLHEPEKANPNVLQKFEKLFESNACSSCYEMMVPPHVPYTLFPCGHNMCRVCLFVNGRSKQKQYTLKVKKCGLCIQNINNYAQNLSLMKLIQKYTNSKNQVNEELDELVDEDAPTGELASRLKLRCEILQKQKRSIATQLVKQIKSKQVLSEVMSKLAEERNKNSKQTLNLEEQLKLIEIFLKEKKLQLQKIKLEITGTEEKRKIVDQMLQPLKLEKEKLQVLEVAKLLHD